MLSYSQATGLGNKAHSMTGMNSIPSSGENGLAAAAAAAGIQNSWSLLFRSTAVRMCRTKWYGFLRRVFRYQNDSNSDLGSNPFNFPTWIILEFLVVLLQITAISFTLPPTYSKQKKAWPVTIWMLVYQLACVLSLPLLYWRWQHCCSYDDLPQDAAAFHLPSAIQGDIRRTSEESSSNIRQHPSLHLLMNKWRSCLEMFFAVWFAVGIVWTFSGSSSIRTASPMHQLLCISLLVWNGISYSFTFSLFLFFCCCIPVLSNHLGYNISTSSDRGATEDDISKLPSWRYKQVDVKDKQPLKCSICLTRYRDREEMRRLPCSHVFHLMCVDRWLIIAAYCPLCKQELARSS